jgi:hypothetical protein
MEEHLSSGGYPGTPTGGQRFATRNVWKYNVDTSTWTAMLHCLKLVELEN